MEFLDIGVLSEISGVPTSTLRYYEEKGLIESLGRHGLRRQFGPETLTRMALISLGKTAGFSLDDIKNMLRNEGVGDLPRHAFRRRAEEIATQIKQLRTLQNALLHVAECSANSHMDCPRFQKLMRLAPTLRKRSRNL